MPLSIIKEYEKVLILRHFKDASKIYNELKIPLEALKLNHSI